MAASRDYQNYLIDLFASFGRIVIKRMFGAIGLYAGDVMFGLVADEIIYLKITERDRKLYEDEGSKPFGYRVKSRDDRTVIPSYFSLPERLYDEPEELALWARRAYEAAAASPRNEEKRRGRMKERSKKRSARQPTRRRTRS